MDDYLPFSTLPEPPAYHDGAGVLARLIESIGFRLQWATEGLEPEDLTYQPTDESMSINDLMRHIYKLIVMSASDLGAPTAEMTICDDHHSIRHAVLQQLSMMREALLTEGLPETVGEEFWLDINGPLSDVLTHIGQINTWRRFAGNPPRSVNYLLGTVD